MAASGINMKPIQEVETIAQYTEPLLQFLASFHPDDEKVIMVGHSLGGMNLAVAMDKFPQKIAVAVFLTVFMPDTTNRPSFVLEQHGERIPAENWSDAQFLPSSSSQEHLMSMVLGPKILSRIYNLSPIEDLELAKTLGRPGSMFLHDLTNLSNFSDEGYGSVAQVYVVCEEDDAIPEEFQRWMVMVIKGSDHMPMFSKPEEICNCLKENASKFA